MTNFNKYNTTLTNEDRAVMSQIKNQITKGNTGKATFDYPEVVGGTYIAQIDKMELREERNRLVFRLTFKLLEGTEEATAEFMEAWPGNGLPKIPYARPITGTKKDAVCLGSVLGLLNRFKETDTIDFDGDYGKLAQTINNIFAEVKDTYAYEIKYNPEEFYRFNVLDILKEAEDSEEAPMPEDDTPEQITPAMIQKPSSYPGRFPRKRIMAVSFLWMKQKKMIYHFRKPRCMDHPCTNNKTHKQIV